MSREIELYRWHNGTVAGEVKLIVEVAALRLEDHNVGELCEDVWDDKDHEQVLSVDTHGAAQVLAHLGVEYGDEPIEILAAHLQTTLDGRSDAVTRFRQLMDAAGVKISDTNA
ncbi:MAG: hypothetical protein JSV45_06580 [Chromatiales bacterium]|nr:MAG: hypothetical protein JSV45_06580 [Chromatiales bacterium]